MKVWTGAIFTIFNDLQRKKREKTLTSKERLSQRAKHIFEMVLCINLLKTTRFALLIHT